MQVAPTAKYRIVHVCLDAKTLRNLALVVGRVPGIESRSAAIRYLAHRYRELTGPKVKDVSA